MDQTQPKGRTALIVEDDADQRSLMAALLEEKQLDTIQCESAEAALAVMLIGEHDIAMIFADVRLPGAMDGIDLAREVKLRWPMLPVVLTSGYPREHIASFAIRMNAHLAHSGGAECRIIEALAPLEAG